MIGLGQTGRHLAVLAAVLGLAGLGPGCGDDSGTAPRQDGGIDAAPPRDGAGGDAAPEPFALDPQRILDDVAWLAAPERQGRLPGTAGNEAALDYVEALFTELGLQPAGEAGGYRQAFSYSGWDVPEPPAVALTGSQLGYGTDYNILSYSGGATVDAEVVFVGYAMTVPAFDRAAYPQCPLDPGGYDDFAGVDLTGKIALALRHGPADHEATQDSCPANEACADTPCLWNFGYKAANARLHGAAALLLVQDYRHDGALPNAFTVGESYYAADFPVLFLDRAPVETAVPDLPTWADAIDTSLAPGGHPTAVTASVSVAAGVTEVETANLLAAVPGTEAPLADETVVIGAHLDHLGVDPGGTLFPGADDNASGTAVVMELARATVGTGLAPKRTLLFAAWNAEEEGLYGSCHYVDQPVYPLDATKAMFSVDMVGEGDGTGLTIYGGLDAANQWLVDVLNGAAQEAGLSYAAFADKALLQSDHACFVRAGVSAVLALTHGDHTVYHTPADTVDKVQLANLEAAARLLWAGLQPLALGEEGLYTTQAVRPRGAGRTFQLAPLTR